jgi:hypothetical protein
MLVGAMVIVATELVHDPLLQTLSEQTDEGTVAHLVAHDPTLPALVEQLVGTLQENASAPRIRPGMRPGDVGQFIIATSLSLLLGVVPGIDDPETARRYIETFVLPAILAEPPEPRPVFGQ